jgi:DNA modification methylase
MTLVLGDCVEAMREMPEASIDAVVCDPPYGLEFMGKEWDRLGDRRQPGDENYTSVDNPYGRGKVRYGYAKDPAASARAQQDWHEGWAREALRVLKPGGHLLAFGGTRTYHRLAAGVEDAGFEIRDTLAWMYGSGFPKSLDVGKAMEAEALPYRRAWLGGRYGTRAADEAQATLLAELERRAAVQDDHDGEGTALKPAFEPVVLARKPLTGTVAANVLAHGTGAINVDACRIGLEGDYKSKSNGRPSLTRLGDNYDPAAANKADTVGRWPANVMLDEEAARLLDEQAGTLTSGAGNVRRASGSDRNGNTGSAYGSESRPAGSVMVSYGDTGGASRFFYCAKASRRERNEGLGPRKNVHPTVKPIEVMRWLIRLVTPPGGVVLDPFVGSGTTGIAAVLEGVEFVGVERDPEYVEIARARIAWWSANRPAEGAVARVLPKSATRKAKGRLPTAGELGLWDDSDMLPDPGGSTLSDH